MPRISALARLAFLPLGLAFLPAGAFAQPAPVVAPQPSPALAYAEPPGPLARPNPLVLQGAFANGMRYAVMQRGANNGDLSIRLYIMAGSSDETDKERGAAHFLEHMAFNGSTSFPAGAIMDQFQRAGVGFGRDQNAQTDYWGTTYSLDIPAADAAKLDLSLRWLRDVADGLTLAPADIDRERGVILAEYRGGLGPLRTIQNRTESFLGPDLRGPTRETIGTEMSIRALDAPALRAFYERWYRPENALIVMVGNAPPPLLKARIEAAFASWSNPTPPAPRPSQGTVDVKRGLDVLSQTEAHAPVLLQVCRVEPRDPYLPEGIPYWRRRYADELWTGVLDRRLGRLIRSGAAFAGASAGRAEVFRAAGQTCITAEPKGGDWRGSLKTLATEIRRMQLYGLRPEEFTEAVKISRAEVEQTDALEPNFTPISLANLIIQNFVEQDTFDTAAEDLRVRTAGLAQLTAAEVSDAFRKRWAGSGPLITLVSPTPVPAAEIRRGWEQAMSEPRPKPPAAVAAAKWAYGDFGPPGKVVERQAMHDPNFVRLRFANGVKVNFKSAPYNRKLIGIKLRFGAGQQELAAPDIFMAGLGARLLTEGGLKRNTIDDIAQVCEGRNCNLTLAVARDSAEITGAAQPEDFPLEMQYLTAYLSEAGFGASMASGVATSADALYRLYTTQPAFVANLALQNALPKPHVFDLPSERELAAYKAADFARVLGPMLRNDPLEVTVVGDIDEATATKVLAATLGALPPRAGGAVRPDAAKVRYPATPPAPITAYHDGPKDQAAVILQWPLFVWTPARAHEGRALSLLSSIMADQVIRDVRERLGRTYTPRVGAELPDTGDQGALGVTIETTPDGVEPVIAEVKKIAAGLAAGDITADQLEQVRRPALDGAAHRELTDGYWIAMLDGSWARPYQIKLAEDWRADVESVTLDEVKAAAKRWLGGEPMIAIALPRPARLASASH